MNYDKLKNEIVDKMRSQGKYKVSEHDGKICIDFYEEDMPSVTYKLGSEQWNEIREELNTSLFKKNYI